MQKVLVICGPTATGKTKLGIHVANRCNGEIISADSRQVYIGMDIGTGKSIPKNFQFSKSNFQNVGYYTNGTIRIWGYDLVEPNEPFSLAHFQRFGSRVLADIHSRNKLPIIVGGTGLYIKALTQQIPTAQIPRDQDLRLELEKLSVQELQDRLKNRDPDKLATMNNSDKHNPRRLIRAIEIANDKANSSSISHIYQEYEQLWIGLTASLERLHMAVTQNVYSRASDEFTHEINQLDKKGIDWDSPAASATGYTEWRAFLGGDISQKEALTQWITREHNYQKRQLTWFKKLSSIHWFDFTEAHSIQAVEDLVSPWYSKNHLYGISN